MTMDRFEAARVRAAELAPRPADRPLPAALAAGGFGLAVIGLFVVLTWAGLPSGAAWLLAAAAYAAIAWADSAVAWRRHTRAFHDALADLKEEPSGPSIH